jgi:hypothetical protein
MLHHLKIACRMFRDLPSNTMETIFLSYMHSTRPDSHTRDFKTYFCFLQHQQQRPVTQPWYACAGTDVLPSGLVTGEIGAQELPCTVLSLVVCVVCLYREERKGELEDFVEWMDAWTDEFDN